MKKRRWAIKNPLAVVVATSKGDRTGIKTRVRNGLVTGGAWLVLVGLLAACGGASKTVTQTVTLPKQGGSVENAEERDPSEAVTPPEGRVGDTLTLPDEYESNGNSKDDELAWTLKAFDEAAEPNGNRFSIKEAEGGGEKLVRAQFAVTQEAATESGGISPTVFTALDSEGQAYPALSTEIFSPELIPSNSGQIALAPGEQRQGFVAFAIPASAKIEKVEVTDSGFTAPDLAIWTLR